METVDHDLEHVPRRINDFVDVVPVVRVPLHECAERYGVAVVAIRRNTVRGAHAVWLGMSLQWCVVSASLHNSLQGKRVEIYTRVLELDNEDMSELCRNCKNQMLQGRIHRIQYDLPCAARSKQFLHSVNGP